MKERKLIGILRQLPEEEMQQLEKFLHSPFFAVPEDAVVLFSLLRPFYPHFKENLPVDEVLFEGIFPDRVYRAELLNQAYHALFSAVKSCLAHTRLAQDTLLSKRLFMQQCLDLGSVSLFEKTGEELLKILNPVQENRTLRKHSSQHQELHLQFSILSELFLYSNTEKLEVSTQRLKEAIDTLDLHFILNRLLLAVEMENRQQFLDESVSLPFQQELELFAQQHIASKNKETQLYLEVLQLFRHPLNIDRLRTANQNLLANLTDIDTFDAKNLLALHINQLLRLGKAMDTDVIADVLRLYEEGLKARLIPEGTHFHASTFINIANTYSLASKFKQGRQFIQQYQALLHPTEKVHIVPLCTAYLLFYEGKFQEAFHQFDLVELGQISFRHALVARPLFLRCRFEIWASQPPPREDRISASIDAFRQFFRRSTILNAKEKKRYIDFAAILSSIVKYGAIGWSNERTKKRLLEKCQTPPLPYAHIWLQQKIAEIK